MELLFILVSICVIQAQQVLANERPIITGGQSVMSLEQIEKDNILQKGIREAVMKAKENLNLNSEYHLVAKSITATSQVVEGILYRVRIEISPRDEKEKTQDCLLSDRHCPKKYVCTFTVWSRAWLEDPAKKLRLDDLKCEEKN